VLAVQLELDLHRAILLRSVVCVITLITVRRNENICIFVRMFLFFNPHDGFGMETLNQTFLGECISVNLERSNTLASIVSRLSATRPRRDFSFRQSVQTSSVAYPSSYSVIYWDLYLRCKATGRGDHSPAQVLMLKTTGAHFHAPNTLLN
jgi:hypothetical protein